MEHVDIFWRSCPLSCGNMKIWPGSIEGKLRPMNAVWRNLACHFRAKERSKRNERSFQFDTLLVWNDLAKCLKPWTNHAESWFKLESKYMNLDESSKFRIYFCIFCLTCWLPSCFLAHCVCSSALTLPLFRRHENNRAIRDEAGIHECRPW